MQKLIMDALTGKEALPQFAYGQDGILYQKWYIRDEKEQWNEWRPVETIDIPQGRQNVSMNHYIAYIQAGKPKTAA